MSYVSSDNFKSRPCNFEGKFKIKDLVPSSFTNKETNEKLWRLNGRIYNNEVDYFCVYYSLRESIKNDFMYLNDDDVFVKGILAPSTNPKLKEELEVTIKSHKFASDDTPQRDFTGFIQPFIDEMIDTEYSTLVKGVFEKHEEEFSYLPASKGFHHNYTSGLIIHVFQMLKLAKSYCEMFPRVNKSLLYAGIILHDIGKVTEYIEVAENKFDYTSNERLTGHIPEGYYIVKTIGEALKTNSSKLNKVLHMILSHHTNSGREAVSGVVQQQFLEAHLVHFFDVLSSKGDEFCGKTYYNEYP